MKIRYWRATLTIRVLDIDADRSRSRVPDAGECVPPTLRSLYPELLRRWYGISTANPERMKDAAKLQVAALQPRSCCAMPLPLRSLPIVESIHSTSARILMAETEVIVFFLEPTRSDRGPADRIAAARSAAKRGAVARHASIGMSRRRVAGPLRFEAAARTAGRTAASALTNIHSARSRDLNIRLNRVQPNSGGRIGIDAIPQAVACQQGCNVRWIFGRAKASVVSRWSVGLRRQHLQRVDELSCAPGTPRPIGSISACVSFGLPRLT